MSTRVVWVRYGREAAEALRATIAAAKGDDPLAPVTVVVPSNHVGVATRRLLASGELGPVAGRGLGLAAVAFLTIYRMAELLGSARLAGQGRRPVSTPVLAAAMRQALATDPGIFAPVAEHPATEMALVAAYQELRDLSVRALERLSAQSERAADIVRLHRAARSRLGGQFFDEQDLITVAREVLAGDPESCRGLGSVVVYLPQRFSRHGAALVATVAERAEVHVLAGRTGDPKADLEVIDSIRRLGPAASSSVERDELPGPVDPMDVVSAERTRIVTTSDADEEVRAAVRAVIDGAREGVRLERTAVLYGAHEPYARLVHEQFVAAGIAHNGAAVVPLTARVTGRTLLGLFALPRSGFRRTEVFSWLAGGRLRHGDRVLPVASWERLSRDAGVVAGRDEWDRLLLAHADVCDAEADQAEADSDAPEWRAERRREDAEQARALRSFTLELIDDLAEAAAQPRSWAEHVAWARAHLDDLLGLDRHRSGWPLVERKAAERTERALDRLACLEAVEGPVPLDVFSATLTLELEADLGRVGRMGEGVLVGSVSMGVGLDLDLVILLGLAEGSLPAPHREDSLLPDEERKATAGELSARSGEPERQHHAMLAALAGARRHLLCVPRGDLRQSNERVPSRWVTDVASTLAGARVIGAGLLGTEAPWLHHIPSFDAGLRRVAFPATEQEHHLRALLAQGSTRSTHTTSYDLADPGFVAGAEVVVARRSSSFTRFDGNLAGLPVPSPAAGVTSATRLEAWAVCPFAYFIKEILHVEPVENPEDRLRISPLALGSLVHEVLERFIDEVLARPGPAQPRPEDPWSDADRRRLLAIAECVCDRYQEHGLVGRPIFWQRDRRRIIADLVRFLGADSAHRAAHGTRPVAAELAFGMPAGRLATVRLPLADGRAVRFRGKADRLDVATDGTLEVIDYKTGARDRYAGLSEERPDAGGTVLQLPVYALAARLYRGLSDAAVRSEYWFTSAKGDFERIGYLVTADVLERVRATVAQMVTGIEAGVFPHHPTASSTSPVVECRFCDPDALGVVELRRQSERKRGDQALAVFYALAEGSGNGDLDEVDAGEVASA